MYLIPRAEEGLSLRAVLSPLQYSSAVLQTLPARRHPGDVWCGRVVYSLRSSIMGPVSMLQWRVTLSRGTKRMLHSSPVPDRKIENAQSLLRALHTAAALEPACATSLQPPPPLYNPSACVYDERSLHSLGLVALSSVSPLLGRGRRLGFLLELFAVLLVDNPAGHHRLTWPQGIVHAHAAAARRPREQI